MKGKATDTHAARLVPLLFALGRRMKQELASEDLGAQSWLHLETLRFIAENGAPQMSEIAEYLKVTPPTATALIEALVQERYLARARDTKDRRRVLLSVTKKGETRLKEAVASRERAFRRVIAPLSVKDRAEFARILGIITQTA